MWDVSTADVQLDSKIGKKKRVLDHAALGFSMRVGTVYTESAGRRAHLLDLRGGGAGGDAEGICGDTGASASCNGGVVDVSTRAQRE